MSRPWRSPFRYEWSDAKRIEVVLTFIRRHGPASSVPLARYVHTDVTWMLGWLKAAAANGSLGSTGTKRLQFTIPRST